MLSPEAVKPQMISIMYSSIQASLAGLSKGFESASADFFQSKSLRILKCRHPRRNHTKRGYYFECEIIASDISANVILPYKGRLQSLLSYNSH